MIQLRWLTTEHDEFVEFGVNHVSERVLQYRYKITTNHVSTVGIIGIKSQTFEWTEWVEVEEEFIKID